MSKNKGSAYEREICKLLSLWWTEGRNDSIFWRTAASGGRSTTRAKKGKATKNQSGDICAIDSIGEDLLRVVAIEVKKGYSKFTMMDLLDRAPKAAEQEYEKWIKQAKESQKQSGSLYWMIISKRDKRVPIILLPRAMVDELGGLDPIIENGGGSFGLFCVLVNGKHNWVYMFLLETFLLRVKPDHIKQIKRKE